MKSAQRRRADPAKLQAICDKFNAIVKVGDKVRVRKDNGTSVETTTQSLAEVLSGHTPVIVLAGISGCYALDRVTPLVNGVLA